MAEKKLKIGYFCDECGAEFSGKLETIEVRINTTKGPTDYIFCSWDCAIDWFKRIDSNDFSFLLKE